MAYLVEWNFILALSNASPNPRKRYLFYILYSPLYSLARCLQAVQYNHIKHKKHGKQIE